MTKYKWTIEELKRARQFAYELWISSGKDLYKQMINRLELKIKQQQNERNII